MRYVIFAAVALASLALAGCEIRQRQLVCTRAGHEVYRSAPVDSLWLRDKDNSWAVGTAYYTPEPGTTCQQVLVR